MNIIKLGMTAFLVVILFTAQVVEPCIIVEIMPTALPDSTSTPIPTYTPTPTPTPTSTPTNTPTPLETIFLTYTPTLEPLPGWQIKNVVRWAYLVEKWLPLYPELDVALVLGVIGQESQGFHRVVDGFGESGGTGLMQVIPRTWTGTQEQLKDASYNLYVGMGILNSAIKQAGEVRTGLGAYNCGFVSLYAEKCWSFGGYAYADRILNVWLPHIHNSLETEYVPYPRLRIPLNYYDFVDKPIVLTREKPYYE